MYKVIVIVILAWIKRFNKKDYGQIAVSQATELAVLSA